MKVNITIVRTILTLNKDVCVLINKMQQQGNHLDEPDMTKLRDLELKMKFHAKTYPEEWRLFQTRNPQTNEIDGVSMSQIS